MNWPPPGIVSRPPRSSSTAYSKTFALTATGGTLAVPSGPGPRVPVHEAEDVVGSGVLRAVLRRARRRAGQLRACAAAAVATRDPGRRAAPRVVRGTARAARAGGGGPVKRTC